MESFMKLLLVLSCVSFFSYSHAMLRPSAPRAQRILKFAPQPQTPTSAQMTKLKAQRDAAELQAHKARQEAQFWKHQAQRCQRNGCTKVCLTHVQNNCQQAYKEELEKAKQAFYKQQSLDGRIPVRPLRPTAQK